METIIVIGIVLVVTFVPIIFMDFEYEKYSKKSSQSIKRVIPEPDSNGMVLIYQAIHKLLDNKTTYWFSMKDAEDYMERRQMEQFLGSMDGIIIPMYVKNTDSRYFEALANHHKGKPDSHFKDDLND